MTETQIMTLQIAMTTLCFLLAGMDPDGLTLKDGLVCVFTTASGAGGLSAAFTPGARVTGAVFSAISATLSTGIWLNNHPSLNQSMVGGSN